MELHYGHWHLGRYLRAEIGRFGLYANRCAVEVWHRTKKGPHRVYVLYFGPDGRAYFTYSGGLMETNQPNPHRRH